MTLWKWSRTASSNATADATVNWAEGMSPSAVNDSGRAMMAATAKYRDDIAGAIATGGTSTAYTVASYQAFTSLANMDGKVVAFTPHTTNGATVTLNVDSLGAKPLRSAPSVELPAGVLVQGTPYLALYNNSDAVWYLHGFYGNPYNVPIGSGIPFFGSTAPNSSFVFPYGQAISRTTYSALFAVISTTYGTGDGSTTFNVPDLRGRVFAGKDDMGGVAAGRVTSAASGIDGATLGATGGEQAHTLTIAELPIVTPSGTISLSPSSISNPAQTVAVDRNLDIATRAVYDAVPGTTVQTATFTGTSFGSGNAHNNMPPALVSNFILRVI